MSSNAIESAQFAENRASDRVSDKTSALPQNSGQTPTNSSTLEGRASELASLVARLSSNSLKKQLLAIRKLAELGASESSASESSASESSASESGASESGASELRLQGEEALASFVRDRMSKKNPDEPTAAHGSAYQVLYSRALQGSASDAAKALIEDFPDGLVCPQSDKDLDYRELQMLLVQKEYEQADKLTNQKLCELAGANAVERKWVYFTEVGQIPVIDLQAIDIMWGLYSEDKFGWRKQRDLWVRLGKDWDRLWIQLLWKSTDGVWTRYPNEFIWDLEKSPAAHLPLSNQLRGVRTMSALLSHPAWNQS